MARPSRVGVGRATHWGGSADVTHGATSAFPGAGSPQGMDSRIGQQKSPRDGKHASHSAWAGLKALCAQTAWRQECCLHSLVAVQLAPPTQQQRTNIRMLYLQSYLSSKLPLSLHAPGLREGSGDAGDLDY